MNELTNMWHSLLKTLAYFQSSDHTDRSVSKLSQVITKNGSNLPLDVRQTPSTDAHFSSMGDVQANQIKKP